MAVRATGVASRADRALGLTSKAKTTKPSVAIDHSSALLCSDSVPPDDALDGAQAIDRRRSTDDGLRKAANSVSLAGTRLKAVWPAWFFFCMAAPRRTKHLHVSR